MFFAVLPLAKEGYNLQISRILLRPPFARHSFSDGGIGLAKAW